MCNRKRWTRAAIDEWNRLVKIPEPACFVLYICVRTVGMSQGVQLYLGVGETVDKSAFWGVIYPCSRNDRIAYLHVCKEGSNLV